MRNILNDKATTAFVDFAIGFGALTAVLAFVGMVIKLVIG